MAEQPANLPYRWLAEYYDRVFGVDRSALEAARREVLGPILPRVNSGCDLACGSGTEAVAMAWKGVRMFAVDLSPAMCRLARQKARIAGVRLQVLCADMRTFRLPSKVDLVTCEGDALNHVPGKSDLIHVARSVAKALSPGGYFYFDVNNRAGFKSYWGTTLWMEAPGVVAVLRGTHDCARDHAWVDVEWFIRSGRCWKRRHERVDEVCWGAAEIRRTLRAAGFTDVRAWDSAPFFANSIVGPGCRTVYLARMPR